MRALSAFHGRVDPGRIPKGQYLQNIVKDPRDTKIGRSYLLALISASNHRAMLDYGKRLQPQALFAARVTQG